MLMSETKSVCILYIEDDVTTAYRFRQKLEQAAVQANSAAPPHPTSAIRYEVARQQTWPLVIPFRAQAHGFRILYGY